MSFDAKTDYWLKKLLGTLVKVHGYYCMGSDEHYAMLIGWVRDEQRKPFVQLLVFPENHKCIRMNYIPFFNTKKEAIACKDYEITAYKFYRVKKGE